MNEPTDPLNPYAPSIQLEFASLESELGGPGGLPAWRIVYTVIVSVTLSGTLFGLLMSVLILTATVSRMAVTPRPADAEGLLLAFLFLTIGCSVAAALASFLMVPLWFWLFGGSAALAGRSWNDPRLRHLAAFSGFSSGWIAVFCLLWFDFSGALLGLAPGGFSAVVTPILMRWMLRRAKPRLNHT